MVEEEEEEEEEEGEEEEEEAPSIVKITRGQTSKRMTQSSSGGNFSP